MLLEIRWVVNAPAHKQAAQPQRGSSPITLHRCFNPKSHAGTGRVTVESMRRSLCSLSDLVNKTTRNKTGHSYTWIECADLVDKSA